MAEAASPSTSSADDVYFSRLSSAVRTVARKCLLYILRREVDPGTFLSTINRKIYLMGRLTNDDRKLITEVTVDGTTDYERFDNTLLYKILRNLGNLDAPTKGWGKKPKEDDESEAADIERIRCVRNDSSHKHQLSEEEYKEYWTILQCVCTRMDQRFSGARFGAELQAIEKSNTNRGNSNSHTNNGISDGPSMQQNFPGTSGTLELVENRNPNRPGKPVEDGATACTITITWQHPEASDDIVCYEVWYRTITWRTKWNKLFTIGRTYSHRVENLQSNTEYVFKLRAHHLVGAEEFESRFGPESEVITTKETPAIKMIHHGGAVRVLPPGGIGEFSLREWNLIFDDQVVEDFLLVRKLVPGNGVSKSSVVVSKTILLMGASGCGKSSLINAFINYMYDVTFDDCFRLTVGEPTSEMVPEERKMITKYILPCLQGSRVKFHVNIIDVPGYTCDPKQDRQIKHLVEKYFELCRRGSYDIIDCVGFVVTQSHLYSPLVEPDYILKIVRSLLSLDLTKILQVFVTSGDPTLPMSSSVVKKIEEMNPDCKKFRFNNLGLNCSAGDMARNYWKMGLNSFQEFASELRMGPSATFGQSSEILMKRNFLDHLLWSSPPFIQTLINSFVCLQEEKKMAEKMVERNIQTEVVLDVDKKEISLNEYHLLWAYNCANCQFTCLSQCSDREDYVNVVDNISRRCHMCGCAGSDHELEKTFYYFELKKVAKSAEDIRTKYDTDDVRSIVGNIDQLLHRRQQEMKNILYLAQRYVQLLKQKLAHSDNSVPVKDVIEYLIQEERFENFVGSQKRIRVYESLKRLEY